MQAGWKPAQAHRQLAPGCHWQTSRPFTRGADAAPSGPSRPTRAMAPGRPGLDVQPSGGLEAESADRATSCFTVTRVAGPRRRRPIGPSGWSASTRLPSHGGTVHICRTAWVTITRCQMPSLPVPSQPGRSSTARAALCRLHPPRGHPHAAGCRFAPAPAARARAARDVYRHVARSRPGRGALSRPHDRRLRWSTPGAWRGVSSAFALTTGCHGLSSRPQVPAPARESRSTPAGAGALALP